MKTPSSRRLTIGVTGHRRIEDTPEIRRILLQIFGEVSRQYGGNGKRASRFRILTPLAEGADRIVAETALAYDGRTIIQPVLPLVPDDYLQDFQSPESRRQFARLMQKGRSPITLRTESIAGEYPAHLRVEARREAYARVGRFVVDHCDVLIALWDGKRARNSGGTGDIAAYALAKQRATYVIAPHTPDGFVFHPGASHS